MSKERVMLVDDSSYMRGILKRILRSAGYEDFVEASDGVAAVESYEREKPDVVLMDIVMPRKNGIEALREIKSLDDAARVIMVSAVGQEVIIEEALSAGAQGFIVKPFQADQVTDAIDQALVGGPER